MSDGGPGAPEEGAEASRLRALTKTDFTTGLRCALAVWLRHHDRAAAGPPPPGQALRLADGEAVDRLAQAAFPGGVRIEGRGLAAAEDETVAALAAGARRLYQPAVRVPWGGCRPDVLDVDADGGATLREVKATLDVKERHVWDLAFQAAVLHEAGFEVRRAVLVHLDPEARGGPPASRFVEADRTAEVEALRAGPLGEQIAAVREAASGAAPVVGVGPHCTEPVTCAFVDRCWAGVPADSVRRIPGLTASRLDRLEARGYARVGDLPETVRLPARTAAYVRLHREGPSVDGRALAAWRAALIGPVRVVAPLFDARPVPAVDGVRPYGPVPVGVAVGRMDGDGLADVTVALAEDDDPFASLAPAFWAAVGARGHVVADRAGELRPVLGRLAAAGGEVPRGFGGRVLDLGGFLEGAVHHPDVLLDASLAGLAAAILGEAVPAHDALVGALRRGERAAVAEGLRQRLAALAGLARWAAAGAEGWPAVPAA